MYESILLLGNRGSGKTVFSKQLITRILREKSTYRKDEGVYQGPYLLVYDPYFEYTNFIGLEVRTFTGDLSYPFLRFNSAEELLDNAQSDSIIILEELMTIDQKENFSKIRKLVTGSRHLRIDFISTTQRPKHIPIVLLALFSSLYVFQLHYQPDIEVLRPYLTEAQIDALPNLSPGQHFVIHI